MSEISFGASVLSEAMLYMKFLMWILGLVCVFKLLSLLDTQEIICTRISLLKSLLFSKKILKTRQKPQCNKKLICFTTSHNT